ncbi:pyridoxamine 5'-phosphate oxidase [Legionella sp. CNM-4043-24]|uniref:pyridoxamine 5'-phosphate oxidase n=1 Tax=Legionella sp. CNM-4043-24 TaxID=3421646 RepID=UPI00403B1106
MADWQKVADSRRNYGKSRLDEEHMEKNPVEQFKRWFADVADSETGDPTAMVLSTVDERGLPDSRVVLLKGIDNNGFVFYTNYDSVKAMQLRHKPYAALNFYWPSLSRQIRIRGSVSCASREQSDQYFASRPFESQLSAIASPQSREISSRQWLEDEFNKLLARHEQEPIVRPENWGGYVLMPDEMEFWQGRDNRLHDRHHYRLHEQGWQRRRLAP